MDKATAREALRQAREKRDKALAKARRTGTVADWRACEHLAVRCEQALIAYQPYLTPEEQATAAKEALQNIAKLCKTD